MDKAVTDRERYKQRLRDAIREKLPQVIADTDLITAVDGTRVRVRVPILEEPYLRPRQSAGEGAGGGSGGEPGHEHQDFGVDVELDLDEVEALLFSSLGLPRLKPKATADVLTGFAREGVSRSGPMPRLDKKRTLIEAFKAGGLLSEQALRFYDMRPVRQRQAKAVVILARDVSGSMDEHKRYLVRTASFWIVRWLRRNYPHVETRFIAFDTEAQECSEHDFFHIQVGGGTEISSGLKLAQSLLESYPPAMWNRYVLCFSDSETWSEDIIRVGQVIDAIAPECALIAYGDVKSANGWSGDWASPQLIELLKRKQQELANVRYGSMREASDIAKWLRIALSEHVEAEPAAGREEESA